MDDYEFDATLVHETPNAYLLDVGDDENLWFPKSLTREEPNGRFSCPEWLAIEKGVA